MFTKKQQKLLFPVILRIKYLTNWKNCQKDPPIEWLENTLYKNYAMEQGQSRNRQ